MEPSDTAALGRCTPCGVSFKMEYGCICSKFPPLLEDKTPTNLEQPAQKIKLEATEGSDGNARVGEYHASPSGLSIPERDRARTPPITSCGGFTFGVPIPSQTARDQTSSDTRIRVKLEQPIEKVSNTTTVREAVHPPPDPIKTDTRSATRPFVQPVTQRPPTHPGNGSALRGRVQTHAVFQPQGYHMQAYPGGPVFQNIPLPVAMNGGQNQFGGHGFGGPPNFGRDYGNEPVHWNSQVVAQQNYENKMRQEVEPRLSLEEFQLRCLEVENTAFECQKEAGRLRHKLTHQLAFYREQGERIRELEEKRQKGETSCMRSLSLLDECESKSEPSFRTLKTWRDQYWPSVNNTTGVQQSNQHSNQQSTQGQQDQYELGVDGAGLERRSYGFGTKRRWEESQDDMETHHQDPSSTRMKRSRGGRKRRD